MPENNIEMIPIGLLLPHPDNPRKDLGDLSELAENIQANGVLQNLTVVPAPESDRNRYAPMNQIDGRRFRVVIGHRRLAAARLAGLKELPCVIAEKMTPEEQIGVMLSENIQRSALTPVEEAAGFQQLSLDFGMTPKEIAGKVGFHESTVRSRLKLAELDKSKAAKGLERGATLEDFGKLYAIQNPETRDDLLKSIGTANFDNRIKQALSDEKFLNNIRKWQEIVGSFAVKIPAPNFVSRGEGGDSYYECGEPPLKLDYVIGYNRWTRDEESPSVPTDAGTRTYYFFCDGDGLDFCIKLFSEHFVDKAKRAERARRQAEESARERRNQEMKSAICRHYELRRDFVRDYGAAKSNAKTIMRNASDLMFRFVRSHRVGHDFLSNPTALFREFYGEAVETETEQIRFLREMYDKEPEKALLITAFWMAERAGNDHPQSYVKREWSATRVRYENYYTGNRTLDQIYYFLQELGYELSDEEKQMRDGTHPLFDKEPGGEEE